MTTKIYDKLPQEAKDIRIEVFMQEQGFENEFDEIDDASIHLVLFDDSNKPLGTCRVYFDNEKDSYIFGRLAVTKSARGKGLGAVIVKSAEEEIKKRGGSSIQLHAQTRVANFYEKQGYTQFGEMDYDEYCPHIWMKKSL